MDVLFRPRHWRWRAITGNSKSHEAMGRMVGRVISDEHYHVAETKTSLHL